MHAVITKMLFLFVLILGFLPMIQAKYECVELKPLQGYFPVHEDPSFVIADWLDGKYQIEKQTYLDQNIGFRSFFIRLHNQLHYTFFNEAIANGVIVGRNQFLYESGYIAACLGRDFVGYPKIYDQLHKLQKIKDTLKTKGIDIIVVLAPGKGSFFEEYIPLEYEPFRKTTTNYEVYGTELDRRNIPYIDFQRWFKKLKNTSRYPLFPKTGTHWSKYAELLAADSMINYIGDIQGVDMPKMSIEEIQVSKDVRDTDDDIERGMNLLFDIEDLVMGYPSFKIEKQDSGGIRILTVADSYYWGMFKDVYKRQVIE